MEGEAEVTSPPLEIGDIFGNEEEAKEKVKRFNVDNYVDFIVETNNQKYLKMVCKHGLRHRVRRPKHERSHQHHNFLECKATIAFYKSKKEGTLKCTVFDNQHNHPVLMVISNTPVLYNGPNFTA